MTLHRINDTTVSFLLPPSKLGWKLSIESEPQMSPVTPPSATSPHHARNYYPAVVRESLLIFADPDSLARDPLSDGALPPPGMLYFGAGFHRLGGQFVLPPNVTHVYVAGGAWVSGGFISASSNQNISLSGRGVVSGSEHAFLKDPKGMSPCRYDGSFCWSLVNLDQGAGYVTAWGQTLWRKFSFVPLYKPNKWFR